MEASELRLQLRHQLPITERWAYYDHAAVAPLPRRSAEAMRTFVDQATQEGDTRWQDWSAGVERTRHVAAELIGGQATEIALVPNTTHAISLVAEGFPWRPGDSVVVPDNEFPSNLLPWRNLARRGVQLRLVPTPSNGTIEPEDIVSQIDDSTRLVALSWVGFASGYRCDIEAIAERVHDRGCLLLVDAIQGLGAFPLNVRTCSIDFLAADGHKWLLGPEGAGILYIHQPHLELLQPLNVGWNSLAGGSFEPESVDLKKSAARYEGGSHSMVGMLGLGASLQMLMEYGCHHATSPLATAIQENVQWLEEMLTGAGFDVDLPGDPARRSGILGVRWPEADAGGPAVYLQARKYLLERQVVVSVRGRRLRVATHAYNDLDDHRRLLAAVVDFRRLSNQ